MNITEPLGCGHFDMKIKNAEVLNFFAKTKNTKGISTLRFFINESGI